MLALDPCKQHGLLVPCHDLLWVILNIHYGTVLEGGNQNLLQEAALRKLSQHPLKSISELSHLRQKESAYIVTLLLL